MDDLDLGATIRGYLPGQKVFQRFTLRKILGRGGMGVVWQAMDESLGREVALKFLPEIVAADKQAVQELKRETRRSLDLTHPHIVRIYDFVQDAAGAAISMEFVDGATLASLKVDQPKGRFEPAQLETWLRELCGALEYAHARAQVVHRDLKPANFMVDGRGELKIADFGIAASVSESVSRVSVQAGTSGTPVYMSPQQMMGEKPAITDDIYALGATLFDLLTSKPPFYAGNVTLQVMNKVAPSMANRRIDLEVTGAAIPDTWERTIAACLSKEPENRPKSAAEVATLLGLRGGPDEMGILLPVKPNTSETELPNQAAEVTEPAAIESSAEQAVTPASPPKSKRAVAFALLILAVLGTGVGWYFKIYQPEQIRLEAVRVEQARLANEEAIRIQTERDEQARITALETAREDREYSEIVSEIDGVIDGSAASKRDKVDLAVVEYAELAPDRYRIEVASHWDQRLTGWETHRLSLARGGLRIRTVPAGVEVQIGSLALEKSPVTLKEVRLGTYPIVIKAEGYDAWRSEIEIVENEFADPNPIELVRSTGKLSLTSNVSEGTFVLRQRGEEELEVTEKLPWEGFDLPTGSYELIAMSEGLKNRAQDVEVVADSLLPLEINFEFGSAQIDSVPAGSEIWQGDRQWGKTPLRIRQLPLGGFEVILRQKGFAREELSGLVESEQLLQLTAQLREGGLDDVESLVEAGWAETKLIEEPEVRANALLVLVMFAMQLDGHSKPQLVEVMADHLIAVKEIKDPARVVTIVGSAIDMIIYFDLGLSREYAEMTANVIPLILDPTERSSVWVWVSKLWMHPSEVEKALAVMTGWFDSKDADWVHLSQIAGLYAKIGNPAMAQRVAKLAEGPYRESSISGALATAAEHRKIQPALLSFYSGEIATAKRQLSTVTGEISFTNLADMANIMVKREEYDLLDELMARVEPTMRPHFPSIAVSFATMNGKFEYAEQTAEKLRDSDTHTLRSTAFQTLADAYLQAGQEDLARKAALHIVKYDKSGLGMMRAVPILVGVGEIKRAKELARHAPKITEANKYLAGYGSAMFASLDDERNYNRVKRLSDDKSTSAMLTSMALSRIGLITEAEEIATEVTDSRYIVSVLFPIALARVQATPIDGWQELLDKSESPSDRSILYMAFLQELVNRQWFGERA